MSNLRKRIQATRLRNSTSRQQRLATLASNNMTKSPDLNGGTRHLTVILQRLAGIALALAYELSV
jgi:hypothetical protein